MPSRKTTLPPVGLPVDGATAATVAVRSTLAPARIDVWFAASPVVDVPRATV